MLLKHMLMPFQCWTTMIIAVLKSQMEKIQYIAYPMRNVEHWLTACDLNRTCLELRENQENLKAYWQLFTRMYSAQKYIKALKKGSQPALFPDQGPSICGWIQKNRCFYFSWISEQKQPSDYWSSADHFQQCPGCNYFDDCRIKTWRKGNHDKTGNELSEVNTL